MTTEPSKVKAYLGSKENFLLVPNRDFGRRKYFDVQMTRQLSFGKNKSASGSKQWVHPAEALLRGHIVYNVKFLGHVEVEQPKGIEVVKDAIRKMKFNKDLKKAEGQKPPKVELTISVDGVTVQEPKYKVIQHRYPLHRISYCADDKSDKRMFTFIAKEAESSKHHCFVFYSEKCAEEITLTIGQAFDLAYKKFMETSGKDIDMKKQFILLQKKVQQLTQENLDLKARVADLERLIDPQTLENFDKNKQLNSPSEPPTLIALVEALKGRQNAQGQTKASPTKKDEVPVVGRRLENLMMDDTRQAPQTNGVTSPGGAVPLLAPPPPVPPRNNMGNSPQAQQMAPPVTQPAPQQPQQPQQPVDLFGATPFAANNAPVSSNPFPPSAPSGAGDPFGMGAFNPSGGGDLDRQLQNVDRELMDLQIWQESWPWNYMDPGEQPLTAAMLATEGFEDNLKETFIS